VKGNIAAATKAPQMVMFWCRAVIWEAWLISPDLLSAAKPKPAVIRKPMKSSSYSVPMP
jgi:hypothetical protein